jgi:hypothetical protein
MPHILRNSEPLPPILSPNRLRVVLKYRFFLHVDQRPFVSIRIFFTSPAYSSSPLYCRFQYRLPRLALLPRVFLVTASIYLSDHLLRLRSSQLRQSHSRSLRLSRIDQGRSMFQVMRQMMRPRHAYTPEPIFPIHSLCIPFPLY